MQQPEEAGAEGGRGRAESGFDEEEAAVGAVFGRIAGENAFERLDGEPAFFFCPI